MMTEFPVYQSAPHWLLLLLLLRCADRQRCRVNLRDWVICCLRGVALAGAAMAVIMLFSAYRWQLELTRVERRGDQIALLQMPAPLGSLLLSKRYGYDYHMGLLLRFNQTGDPALLREFQRWSQGYLQAFPDANVYFSAIIIARFFHQQEREKALTDEARRLFYTDSRFIQAPG